MRWTLQMALGGGIWGAFAGIFAGAVLGTCYGSLTDNVSLGLDGAIAGSALLFVAGAVYGAIVGNRALEKNEAPGEPASTNRSQDKRDAGRFMSQGPEMLSVGETRHLSI